MSLSRKENAIREQRTNLAITKNLMGPTGKLGVIAQGLGDPIIRSVGGMYDVRFLDDPYEDFSEFDFETTLSGQNGPLAFPRQN
jgi:NADH:ubiquinone oxidoreductase subunit D